MRKLWLDLVATFSAVLILGILIYFKGDWIDIVTPEQRLRWIVGLSAGFGLICFLLSLQKTSRMWFAWQYLKQKIDKFDRTGSGVILDEGKCNIEQQRIYDLTDRLKDSHNWRRRYRDRWLLLCGDPIAIDHLAPTLRRDGWAVTPQAVLLYGGKTGSPDIGWLKQIARIRRRRPVDAMVAVIRTGDDGQTAFDSDALRHQLHLQSHALGWSAPSYVLNANEISGMPPETVEVVACTWPGRSRDRQRLDDDLVALGNRLAERGISLLTQHLLQSCLAQLSQRVHAQRSRLGELIAHLDQSRTRSSAVHGLLFVPLFVSSLRAAETETGDIHLNRVAAVLPSPWQAANWQAIGSHSRRLHGRRIGFSVSTVAAWSLTALLSLWMAGSLISAAVNRAAIADAGAVVARLQAPQKPVAAALDLDVLQKHLDTLEVRQQEGAPWSTRFGLNHDAQIMNALWQHYQSASRRILSEPLQRRMEANLMQRDGMSDQELANGGQAQVNAAYADLKTYLMLAEPRHTDPAFLIPHWLASGQPAMPTQSQINSGGWRDLSQRLITFHVRHLAAHGDWAIAPDASLAGAARQSLIAVIGLQNSTDVLYQSIINDHTGKYPPVSLQALLGNSSSHGLFNTSATVPGIFTRAAWDERVSQAIDEADKQRNGDRDWVLSDVASNRLTDMIQSHSAGKDLKQALRDRYFADYARAWEVFLNSVQWQNDHTLSGTIDQLTLLADAQRSPLLALFKAVSYQAGAGASLTSLSATLVNKAQQLFKGKQRDPSKIMAISADASPLAAAFGPLLRLGNAGEPDPSAPHAAMAAQSGGMSLALYLERVTAVRLKLQQIMMSSDPDAMSRTAAQAILQGKTSDIADSRDYASRVGASLGQQWSGFGSAVFERPLEQTWDVVLRPATASLNAIWRSAIVTAWNGSFAGRYPFADSGNEASLPELARFLRSQGGLIPQFVASQLGGLLERQGDQWVPVQSAGSTTLTLDPQFIAGLNRLTYISNRLFAEGDAKVRFELKPVATGGVTDMRLKFGAQNLHYFNQREAWQPMVWPGEALTGDSHLEWQTGQSGLRTELGGDGRFGFIRLLGKAKVTQLDSAQYQLTWQPDNDSGVPLRMLLRSEAGGGPLDALMLRHFILPQQVFATVGAGAPSTHSTIATR